MADHPTLNDGVGGTFRAATDEVVIGGVTVQASRVKIGFGADGAYADVESGNGLPIQADVLGSPSDPAWSGTGAAGLNAVMKAVYALLDAGLTLSGVTTIGLTNGEGVKGQFGGIAANPSGQISRPGDATAYAAGDLIGNSTTPAAVAYPTLACARVAGGSFEIPRMRLSSNNSSLAGITMRVRLWAGAAAPVYGVGDNGAYAVNPGECQYLGSYTGMFEQFTTKATAILVPDWAAALVKAVAGQNIYWDLQTLDGFTPGSGTWFAATAETRQD